MHRAGYSSVVQQLQCKHEANIILIIIVIVIKYINKNKSVPVTLRKLEKQNREIDITKQTHKNGRLKT
jgi:hypothetical protein